MAKWKTTRGWGHDPESGSDRDSAYSFKITDGHDVGGRGIRGV